MDPNGQWNDILNVLKERENTKQKQSSTQNSIPSENLDKIKSFLEINLAVS